MKILKPIKAQAALEFLTTYGWAFLIILIMIGTLGYFGIFNPSRILPDRCTFSSEFACVDHVLSTVAARVKLKNSMGEPIQLVSVSLARDDATVITCTASPPLGSWSSGQTRELAWSGCSGTGLATGNKGKVVITIRYFSASSNVTYTKESQGEVYSTVQ